MFYTVHPGDDFYALIQTLRAGDEVVVEAGTYTSPGFVAVNWAGTPDAPISIHVGLGPVILQGTSAQNLLNISGSYFTFSGFEITGSSQGLRLQSVDHATIEDTKIHDVGDVGISCNFEPNSCDHVWLLHNEIYATGKDTAGGATGEGMYLGCNNGACTFTNGIVADNYVHDTGGTQGDGIEIKEGAFGNDVRDNVIIRTPYPGITMYGYGGSGAPNIVHRNLVWHTMDNGIQVVGQVIVRNNIVLDAAASGIASKASQTYQPHDAVILNNTIVGTATCVKTNNWPGQSGDQIVNNALYCPASIDLTGGANSDLVIGNNIGTGTSNAATGFALGQATDLENAATGDVWPTASSALAGAGDSSRQPADDFNLTPRTHATVGAYDGGAAMNPGWVVVEGIKEAPHSPPDGPPVNPGDHIPIDPPVHPASGGCCETGGGDPTGLLVLLSWSSVHWTTRFRRRRRQARSSRSSPR